MLPAQGRSIPMPPAPAGGAPGGMAAAPGAPPEVGPTDAKNALKAQLRQAYSELKALAASSGIDWSEIEAAGAAPASARPMGGPPPTMRG